MSSGVFRSRKNAVRANGEFQSCRLCYLGAGTWCACRRRGERHNRCSGSTNPSLLGRARTLRKILRDNAAHSGDAVLGCLFVIRSRGYVGAVDAAEANVLDASAERCHSGSASRSGRLCAESAPATFRRANIARSPVDFQHSLRLENRARR